MPESVRVSRLAAWLWISCSAAFLAGCTSIGPAADQLYPAHSATLERVIASVQT